ncbi:MAG: hypothetical protein GX417_03245 [Clostridiales bacterium]|nr:hypothetical protein [Clostridiales bacterium]
MKKWKIALILILVLGILSFVSYVAILLLSPSAIIMGNAVAYHTKEELTDLYWKNKDLLNSVKDSVLSNKKLLQAMNEEKDGDIGIYVKEDKDFFTEEEWTDIVTVFEELHPYMLMMERKGRPMKFYINFADLELDSGSKLTSLYWFPSEDEIEVHKEWSLADSIEYTQIDGTWYIVEETFPW